VSWKTEDLFCYDLITSPQPGLGRILVTGATGYIGGRLVPELLARGYRVRVMVRAASQEHAERWPGAEIVVADAHDLTKEELEGTSTFDLYPDDAKQYHEDDLEVVKSGRPKLMYEERWMTAHGERWLSTSKIPLIDKSGETKGIIGVALDITDRKRAEEALRQSQERFKLFFEKAPIYAYMISTEGKIVDVNGAALKALGYSKEELLGSPVRNIYSPRSQDKVEKVFEQWKRTGHISDEMMEIITKEVKESQFGPPLKVWH